MNKVVTIIRLAGNDSVTYGHLKVVQHDKIIFECKTLEKGWLDNKSQISSIPAGQYNVIRTYSNRFKKSMYLVENVPNRAGIRIHAGNYASEIQGCILLGTDFVDINKDGQKDIINSRQTVKDFEEVMNNMPFKLEIVDWIKGISVN